MYRRMGKQPLTFFPKTEAEKRQGLAGSSGDPLGGHHATFQLSKFCVEIFSWPELLVICFILSNPAFPRRRKLEVFTVPTANSN